MTSHVIPACYPGFAALLRETCGGFLQLSHTVFYSRTPWGWRVTDFRSFRHLAVFTHLLQLCKRDNSQPTLA